VGTLSDKGKKNAGKGNINQLTAIKNSLVSVLFTVHAATLVYLLSRFLAPAV
jgi:hypothetical protein